MTIVKIPVVVKFLVNIFCVWVAFSFPVLYNVLILKAEWQARALSRRFRLRLAGKGKTMKLGKKILLSGDWMMDFLGGEEYDTTTPPSLDKAVLVPNAVPGYWEDMLDAFRRTPIHSKLEWNPLYTLQRYPQVGSVPDMALPTVLGCFVYHRSFTLDLGEVSGRVVLYIGGAHNTTDLWLNDTYIGKHRGYSSDFSFEVPKEALLDGENTITLTVSNVRQRGYKGRPVSGCTARAANECTGGIYGDIELRILKDNIDDIWVSSAKDCSEFTVCTVGAPTADATVRVLDGKRVVREGIIKAGDTSLTFSSEGLTLWSTDEPKLYVAEVSTEGQTVSRRFGIRRLVADGIRLYLNGKPFMFRAICEHGYYPLTVHPPRDKSYYRAVVRKLKELGFNAIRFHTWVPMPEYMEAADELGVLIEVETPNNTPYREWCDIVHYARRYTSPVMYSSGNEMVIDEDYIEHLRACAALVHGDSDALFSPMSAMRGIEYVLSGEIVDEPFAHNPGRLAVIGEFCDVYNTYSRGGTSYRSDGGDAEYLERCNKVYGKPLLSHEICINGTYIDLSLKDRYRGSRIGDTELFTSVERHLTDKGLIDRAPIYYKNSAAWQQIMRKHCFELCRRLDTFAGYDFLGDIDHHWHTFGYCVGMMNEFYELKIGETVDNVRRYNSDAVLLADLPRRTNFKSGEKVEIPLLISNYGEPISRATLSIRVVGGGKVYLRREVRLSDIKVGEITELYRLAFNMPRAEKPMALKLCVSLSGGNTDCDNRWEMYVFPKAMPRVPRERVQNTAGVVIADDMSSDELWDAMKAGKRVLLFSAGPFARVDNAFQISIAGRTNGHLATVIADSPLMKDFPHEGWCSWQFREMMKDSHTAALDLPTADFAPIIEIASSYKNARREALIFEYRIGDGKLLVCTLNLKESDPGAMWLKNRLIEYAMGDEFDPKVSLSFAELYELCEAAPIDSGKNDNNALNMNDITMRVK